MKLHQRILIILIAGLLATGLLLLRIHRGSCRVLGPVLYHHPSGAAITFDGRIVGVTPVTETKEIFKNPVNHHQWYPI